MVKISELTVRQGNVDVEGTIKEIAEPRSFNKFGRQLRVADAILEDETGTIRLSLWNDDIDKFQVGDKVKITNGYVTEFQGEKQLTAGKFGKMEKLDSGSNEEESQSTEETDGDNESESAEESEDSENEEEIEEAEEKIE